MRLFIAIDLPDSVRAMLARRMETMRRKLQGPARWVPPGNLHLTLVFLGQVEARFLDEVKTATGRATAASAAFRLRLSAGGAFPAAGRARVLWAGVEAGAELQSLHARLAQELEAFSPNEEASRTFHPHVTLARCRPPLGRAAADAALGVLRDLSSDPFDADPVTLYESHTRPDGARHVPLARFPLAGPAGGGG